MLFTFPMLVSAATGSGYTVKIALAHNHPNEVFDEQRAFMAIEDEANCKIYVVTRLRDLDPAKYDGLLVPGGGDIDPTLYGQQNNGLSKSIDTSLDQFQIKAVKKFRKAKKPIIGICKGCQLINVAYGGTLKQDIGAYGDGMNTGSYHYGVYRTMRVSKKSVFYNYPLRSVLHWHHQAVDKLGNGLRATMWDTADGTIEAVEGINEPTFGVQWHPDLMGTSGAYILEKFVSICRKVAMGRYYR